MRTTFPFTVHLRRNQGLPHPGPWLIGLDGIEGTGFADDNPHQVCSPGFKSFFYKMLMQ